MDRIGLLEARLEVLEATNGLKSNTINLLREHVTKLENRLTKVEQYTRRPNIRIHGVKVKNGDGVETKEDVMKISTKRT